MSTESITIQGIQGEAGQDGRAPTIRIRDAGIAFLAPGLYAVSEETDVGSIPKTVEISLALRPCETILSRTARLSKLNCRSLFTHIMKTPSLGRYLVLGRTSNIIPKEVFLTKRSPDLQTCI